MQEITYKESLKVSWLIIWRAMLISMVAIGIPFMLIAGSALSHPESPPMIPLDVWPFFGVLAGAVSQLFVYPLAVRMAVRKHFKGFRVQIVRD
jgi:hypothetical protein